MEIIEKEFDVIKANVTKMIANVEKWYVQESLHLIILKM